MSNVIRMPESEQFLSETPSCLGDGVLCDGDMLEWSLWLVSAVSSARLEMSEEVDRLNLLCWFQVSEATTSRFCFFVVASWLICFVSG